ncbi:S49 family peptidase [Massilia sp. DD77]|uniref:S49 family peptidase n=1 Tax=Massilia sp. DD77 TaxID=3109349 RepID=UPI002FFDB260
MKNRFRIASLIFNQPLMVTEAMLDQAAAWANQQMSLNIVNLSVNGAQPQMMDDDDGPYETQAMREESARRQIIAETGVAIIPVHGVLVSRSMQMNPCETMTSYEQVRAQVSAALADPAVEHLAFDIDSPGGSTTGAYELSDFLFEARGIKPMSAIIHYSGYSAAYLLAAAIGNVSVSRTSGVGSIGVIAKHLDVSARNEQLGLKVTTVYAGAHKNDLSPHEPITEQSMAFLTDIVQTYYTQFVEAVATYRGIGVDVVRGTEANVYMGQKGIDIGLADRLETPQAAIDRITEQVREARAGRSNKTSIGARAKAMALQTQI